MNQFQSTCILRCRALLAATPGLEYRDFEELEGKNEPYLGLRVSDHTSRRIEIYVYLDEAGYMINGEEWTVYERPDYPSDEALIAALVGGLQGLLSQ